MAKFSQTRNPPRRFPPRAYARTVLWSDFHLDLTSVPCSGWTLTETSAMYDQTGWLVGGDEQIIEKNFLIVMRLDQFSLSASKYQPL